MKVETIVTLDEKDRWYLSEETEQNGVKYFLALEIGEDDEPTDKSKIFKEEIDGDDTYLTEVDDEDTLKFLGAVFITKFNKVVDDMIDADDDLVA
jgi:hypothetical protein